MPSACALDLFPSCCCVSFNCSFSEGLLWSYFFIFVCLTMFSFCLNSQLMFLWAQNSWSMSHVLKTLLCSLEHLLLMIRSLLSVYLNFVDHPSLLLNTFFSLIFWGFTLISIQAFFNSWKFSGVGVTHSTFLCILSSWNSK